MIQTPAKGSGSRDLDVRGGAHFTRRKIAAFRAWNSTLFEPGSAQQREIRLVKMQHRLRWCTTPDPLCRVNRPPLWDSNVGEK